MLPCPTLRRGLALALALPLASIASAAAPIGPGSAAWASDQAALEAAIEADSPDVPERIRDFFETHQVVTSLNRLRRAAGLLLRRVPSRSHTPGPDAGPSPYTVSSIQQTAYHLVSYDQKLADLLPEVERGERTLESARKKAARWYRATKLFTGKTGMEITHVPSQEAVFVVFPPWGSWDDEPYVEMQTMTRVKPDGYRFFQDHWPHLVSRFALDQDYRIVALDRHQPEKGYATLLRLLSYLDEIAPGVPGEAAG